MFADTHIHPIMKYVHNERKNLWKSISGVIHISGFLNNIVGIPSFSQADMRRLARGNFQVVFCALHPPEHKILFTKANSTWDNLVDGVASQVISIPKEKIKLYREASYDHFKQLELELKNLVDGQQKRRKLRVNGKRRKCSYKIVKDYSEVEEIVTFNKNQDDYFKIAVVLTIEGLHAIGRGHLDFNDTPNPHNVDDDNFLSRLDRIKGLSNDGGAGWSQSPVLINVTHAFDNGISGHAQALAKVMREKLFKYANSGGVNEPLSPFGKKVIRRMLNLDAQPEGRRIIPDIKHMSTKTRRDYYEIIDAHNSQNSDDIIPVIMSHAAVNGKPLLSENNYNPEDSDGEYDDSTTFNTWSINLYDDEIIRIHETKGLIGLIMDQRVLAGGEKVRLLRKYINNNHDYGNPFEGMSDKEAWFSLVFDQIVHIVTTVMNSNTSIDKKLIWDCICIGSDFDGQIDPINTFKKSTDFDKYKKELKKRLHDAENDTIRQGLSIDEIVHKICFDNVFTFLERNF